MSTITDVPSLKEILAGPHIAILLADGRRVAVNEAGEVASDGDLSDADVQSALDGAAALLTEQAAIWRQES